MPISRWKYRKFASRSTSRLQGCLESIFNKVSTYRTDSVALSLPPLVSEESLIRTDEVVVSEVTLPRDVRELSLALLMDDEDGKTLLGKEPEIKAKCNSYIRFIYKILFVCLFERRYYIVSRRAIDKEARQSPYTSVPNS